MKDSLKISNDLTSIGLLLEVAGKFVPHNKLTSMAVAVGQLFQNIAAIIPIVSASAPSVKNYFLNSPESLHLKLIAGIALATVATGRSFAVSLPAQAFLYENFAPQGFGMEGAHFRTNNILIYNGLNQGASLFLKVCNIANIIISAKLSKLSIPASVGLGVFTIIAAAKQH